MDSGREVDDGGTYLGHQKTLETSLSSASFLVLCSKMEMMRDRRRIGREKGIYISYLVASEVFFAGSEVHTFLTSRPSMSFLDIQERRGGGHVYRISSAFWISGRGGHVQFLDEV
jgi:hypothetical protein